MADYTVVAGEANTHVKKMFEKQKEINIVNTFKTVDDLTKDVVDNGTSFLQVLKSVIVLDFGFTSTEAKDRAEEFIFLQDTLKSNSLRDTKLYLITKDTDLFSLLRGEVGGLPGVHYLNTEVLLIEGGYAPKLLGDIFRGRRDKTGLYHPDTDKQNLTERMKDDRDVFIEDSKSVSREILYYGKDIPVSELSKTDFTDSQAVERLIRQKEKEKLEEERKKSKKKPKNQDIKVNKRADILETSRKPVINRVESPSIPIAVTGTVQVRDQQGMPNLQRMQEVFESLGRDKAVKGKLENDKGVLAFVGERKAGTSGIVANVADVYAMSGRKVLVIDTDLINRTQTRYFGNYDELVDNHYGLGNGLLKVAQGGSLQRAVVQITSRVALLGMSQKEKISEGVVQEIADELGNIIEDARNQYDMVLVDVPNEYLGRYLRGLNGTDKNLLVVENRWYDVEAFINLYLGKQVEDNEGEMVNFMKKSTLILNKFERGRISKEGNELNRVNVMKSLRKKGYPYDFIGVSGEIPHYDKWEDQYLTRVRYIWKDELALGVYKQLFSKVVW